MRKYEQPIVRPKEMLFGVCAALVAASLGSMAALTGCAGTGVLAGVGGTFYVNDGGMVREASGAEVMGDAISEIMGEEPEGEAGAATAHGALHVAGTGLVDDAGEPVQLRAFSSHGFNYLEDYVESSVLDDLKSQWGANALRLELYTGANGGFVGEGTRDQLYSQINDGVNVATREGLYAIIDWHVLNNASPLSNVAGAQDFFDTMSSRYGTHDNVVYEICNEPGTTTSWSDVRAYAEEVIPVIRANDPDAVVIVGTTLSGTDNALTSPLDAASSENVLYGIDSTDGVADGQDVRDELAAALDAGLPVFVSEFGTSEKALAPSDGGSWSELADERNVSFSCESYSDRDLAAGLAAAGYVSQDDLGAWQETGFNDAGSWEHACLRDSLGLV